MTLAPPCSSTCGDVYKIFRGTLVHQTCFHSVVQGCRLHDVIHGGLMNRHVSYRFLSTFSCDSELLVVLAELDVQNLLASSSVSEIFVVRPGSACLSVISGGLHAPFQLEYECLNKNNTVIYGRSLKRLCLSITEDLKIC